VLHTGQHEEMPASYEFFGMPLPHIVQLNRRLPALAPSAPAAGEHRQDLDDLRPDAVLVHGDTSSALMGALAACYTARYRGTRRGGLRTGARYDPSGREEREIVGRLAQWHISSPTAQPVRNLQREASRTRRSPGGEHRRGTRPMGMETLDQLVEAPSTCCREPQTCRPCCRQALTMVTAHRRENWRRQLGRISSQHCPTWLE
jgi:UDP-N-acetylglucosamine 2-epimerase